MIVVFTKFQLTSNFPFSSILQQLAQLCSILLSKSLLQLQTSKIIKESSIFSNFRTKSISADIIFMPNLVILFQAALLFHTAFSQISLTIENCKEYSPDHSGCLRCSQSFYRSPNGICTFANPTCRTYSSSLGICVSCKDGYFLVGVECIQTPQQMPCPFCLKSLKGACTECSAGFYLMDEICRMMDPFCLAFNYAKLICEKCSNGFVPKGQKCISDQIDRKYQCLEYKNSRCMKCSKGLYVSKNGSCLEPNILCRTFNQSNGECTSCYSSFKLENGGVCVNFRKLNPYCLTFTRQKCLSCLKGYYFDIREICQPISPYCKFFDYFKRQCGICHTGFSLIKGTCLADSSVSDDSNCLQMDDTFRCKKCSQGYYLKENSRCAVIPTNCRDINVNTSMCNQCDDQYTIVAGKCVNNKEYHKFCSQIINGVCIKCALRAYKQSEDLCIKVSDFCINFDQKRKQCLSCDRGSTLKNGDCIKLLSDPFCVDVNNNTGACEKCIKGAFFNSMTKKCVPIDPFCEKFNTDLFQCEVCRISYSNSPSGICLPIVTIQNNVPNCIQFDNLAKKCLRCFNLYFLSNNQCIQVSPFCRTYEEGSGKCLSCFSNFSLVNGECVIA